MAIVSEVAAIPKEAIQIASKVEEEVSERAEAAFKRKGEYFDYEKVFFNSLYSVGLFGTVLIAVKLGELIIGITNFLNSNPLTAWVIPDSSVKMMQQSGKVLEIIDSNLTGIAPVVPLGIVGAHSALEYRRIRPFVSPEVKKYGDMAVGLGAMYAIVLAWQGLSYDPPKPSDSENSPVTSFDVPAAGSKPAVIMTLYYDGFHTSKYNLEGSYYYHVATVPESSGYPIRFTALNDALAQSKFWEIVNDEFKNRGLEGPGYPGGVG